MTTVHSIKEQIVLEARSLHNAKERLTTGKFLVEGEEQLHWALESPCQLRVVFAHDKQCNHPLIALLQQRNIPLFFTSDGILKKISDTSYLIPFIAIAQKQQEDHRLKDLVIVLDRVQDFGNIGTIVRTAEAFGIQDFVATREDFDWFYKKAIDASRGKIFSSHLVRYKSGKQTIVELKAQGYQIAVTSLRNSVIPSFAPIEKRPIAIVFGNETTGVSPELEEEADMRIQIPMSGSVESLNVGVAAGISLYELKTKWVLTMLTQKIQSSIGRDLHSTARWIRRIFDVKLTAATPLNADQAIMMMILKCDHTSTPARLSSDAGVADADLLIRSLLEQKLINESHGSLSLTDRGEKALAKIWSIHELVERLTFDGISEENKALFFQVLHKIQSNCETITHYE